MSLLRRAALFALLLAARLCYAAEPIVIADFEGESYAPWQASGEAFGQAPARGALPNQMPVSGFEGRGLVNSFAGGDDTRGRLTLPNLNIERKYFAFLIGGGRHPGQTCLNLLVDGKVARTVTGPNSEHLSVRFWDVSELVGKTVTLEIVDDRQGSWGHINVDQIVQTDEKPEIRDERTELLARAEKSVAEAAKRVKNDKSRPLYHVLPPANWLNDPNGPLFHNGYYHLFFQHNPYGDEWGNMHWAHGRSKDLATWERLPIALWPSKNDGEEHVFSGAAVVNDLGQLMLFYTSIGSRLPEQWVAIPEDDDLIRWKKHPANPIMTEELHTQKIDEWRDPYPFKVGGEHYMVLGGNLNKSKGGQAIVAVYKAKNRELTKWKYLGVLFEYADMNVKNIECPLFFPLDGRWVLIVSQGQPVQYFVGDLDKQTMKFKPTHRGVMDWGNYYAPNAFEDPKGRTILWGWMNGSPPGLGWRHCMTLPRQLSIGDDGTLRQWPVDSLSALRGKSVQQETLQVGQDRKTLADIRGAAFELRLSVELRDAKALSLELPRSNGASSIAIALDVKQLNLAGTAVPLETKPGKPVELAIFVDHSVVEVYADGRECVTRWIDTPVAGAEVKSLVLGASGGQTAVKGIQYWPLKSAWIESTVAEK